jgi:small subunit ribosomal protein S16
MGRAVEPRRRAASRRAWRVRYNRVFAAVDQQDHRAGRPPARLPMAPISFKEASMLRIRLRRTGAKKKPTYRVVVADARAPRDGAFLDILGHYNPRTEPSTVVIDAAKAQRWLANGAQPSDRVARLFKREGIERGGAVATAEAPAAETAPAAEAAAAPARVRARRAAPAAPAADETPAEATASAAAAPAGAPETTSATAAEDAAPAKRPARRRASAQAEGAEDAPSAEAAEGTPPPDSAAAKEEA